ncbi:MAG: outer membrane beta-barrel protein [Candidatus Adiutrix sp.]|jgi:opacity protein-like surface antigen|nr:outer membrane beta-barrel protein [Candidatus Adiutrix sp.]
MRKNLFFLLAALVAWAGVPAAAGAQSGDFYLTPKLGVSYFSSKNHTYGNGDPTDYAYRGGNARFAGALAIGYDFSGTGAPLRTELEYTIRSARETDHDFTFTGTNDRFRVGHKLKADTLMANLYYDFENDSVATPYIGAGLGLAFVKGENNFGVIRPNNDYVHIADGSDHSRKFAWNAAAGVAWDITDSLSLDLGYRYFNINKASAGPINTDVFNLGQSEAKNMNLHEVMLGLRISYY